MERQLEVAERRSGWILSLGKISGQKQYIEVINESVNCLLRLNDEAKLRTDLSEFKSSCKMGSWLLLIPVWLTISSTACWAFSNERQAKYTFAPVCTTVNVSVFYNSFSGKSAETTSLVCDSLGYCRPGHKLVLRKVIKTQLLSGRFPRLHDDDDNNKNR